MLEKGNKTVGNLRRTIYWGGSDFAAERSIQVTKHKVTLDADGNESKHSMTMMRENAHGRAYQTMGLQLMQEHISAEKRARALKLPLARVAPPFITAAPSHRCCGGAVAHCHPGARWELA